MKTKSTNTTTNRLFTGRSSSTVGSAIRPLTSVFCLLVTLALTSVSSYAASSGTLIDLSDSTTASGAGWKYNSSTLTFTIADAANVTITGTTTTRRIVVSPGATATITLRDANINLDNGSQVAACPFDMSGATVNLLLDGMSTLRTNYDAACLQAPDGSTLTIDSAAQPGSDTGMLNVAVGNFWPYGAATIGGGAFSSGGNITINGGSITATNSGYAAAIGDGRSSSGSTITINGGSVTATGNGGVAIGGSAITINGGSITATSYDVAIGSRTITINGGSITAKGAGNNGVAIGGSYTVATITINGGSITASADNDNAAIGGSSRVSPYGGNITITGGTIIAGSAIGHTYQGYGGTVIIKGNALVFATAGINAATQNLIGGKVVYATAATYAPTTKTLTLHAALDIPAGFILTVAPGLTLDVNHQTLTIADGVAGLRNLGTIINWNPISAPASFSVQPASKCTGVGKTVTFTIFARGNPLPDLQWQISTDGGATWQKLDNDATYGGVSTATLTIAATTAGMDGNQYRCVADNSNGFPVHSDPATLTITYRTLIDLNNSSTPTGDGWTYDSATQTFTIVDAANVTITGTTTTNRIVVAPGATATITLRDASINLGNGSQSDVCPIDMTGATVHLLLEGTNTLRSNRHATCLQAPVSSTLTIDSASQPGSDRGTLSAGVLNNGQGLAIGGAGGNITINGGLVSASAWGASAIGGSFATITINGGSVSASMPNPCSGSAIGGGNATIIINGGSIDAHGDGSTAIGGTGATIAINGGAIRASSSYNVAIGGSIITITGGSISATGGVFCLPDRDYAAIGGTLYNGMNENGNITITGGTIIAGSVIGRSKDGYGNTVSINANALVFATAGFAAATLNITGGKVVYATGATFAGATYYGSILTLRTTLDIPSGITLTVGPGITLDVNHQTLTIADGDAGLIRLGTIINWDTDPAIPVITSPLSISGSVGSALNYQIAATNNPTSFATRNLPSGLAVNGTTGVISGTPALSGTYSTTLLATNAYRTGSATLAVSIAGSGTIPPGAIPVITSPLSISGTIGKAFKYQIVATNGPISFAASNLPNGLAVNATTGAITGAPTLSGIHSTTLLATNVYGTGSTTLAVSIVPDPAVIAAQQLKEALEASGNATVTVNGAVNLSLVGGATITSGKTIVGSGSTSTIIGGLTLAATASNTIITGITYTSSAFTIDGTKDIDISHCTFTDTPVVIKNNADNVAFRWNKFNAPLTGAAGYGSAMTITNSGAVTGILLAHNYFTDGLKSNIPAATTSRVVMFNNYIAATGNTSATIADTGAQILSERNIYQGTHNPIAKYGNGKLRTLNNFMIPPITGSNTNGTDTVFAPAYSRLMYPAGSNDPFDAYAVATLIATNAGNTDGKNSITPAASITNATVNTVKITTNVTGATANAASVFTDGNFTLTSNATGFTPTARQWYLDHILLPGVTGSTHTITGAKAAIDAGAYSVYLTTPAGELVASGAFNVTIGDLAMPKIETHPVSQTVTVGGNATLTVTASGNMLDYQWQKNSVNIFGANSASHTIYNAQQSDSGSYHVLVFNASGTATSNSAVLIVNDNNNNSGGGGAGGGGGAPSILWLFAAAALAVLRSAQRRK